MPSLDFVLSQMPPDTGPNPTGALSATGVDVVTTREGETSQSPDLELYRVIKVE